MADIEAPLPIVTGKDRHGLANPVIIQVNHGNSDLAELFSVSRPTVYRTLNRRLSP